MSGRHFSPRGFIIFALFLTGFAVLISMDKGSGPISGAWPFLVLCLVIGATVAICRRMWSEGSDFEKVSRIESQSLYGVLPKKVREWLFP
jgi:hypothetical protein